MKSPELSTPFKSLKIALVSDDLTRSSLSLHCNVINLTPLNYRLILPFFKPDMLLVESCWQGLQNSWRYKIAAYPDFSKRNNNVLQKLVAYAKERSIPTIFWNKEDGVHFSRFIESAKLFDHIFTTDSNIIPQYKAQCPSAKTVLPLTFAISPFIHRPLNAIRNGRICFVGSYRNNLHEGRRNIQQEFFSVSARYGLDIYDRNSARGNSAFRYPNEFLPLVKPAVPYKKTGELYNRYSAALNINTITDSPTMFSRRLIELMACRTPVITNNSLSVETLFKDMVLIAENSAHAEEHIKHLLAGGSPATDKMLADAHKLVIKEYSYNSWLEKIVLCAR